jgi:hypothetical protein
MSISTKSKHKKPNVDDVARGLRLLIKDGQVTELRAVNVDWDGDRRFLSTEYGYYDDMDKMAKDALYLTRFAEGVYLTCNPLNPQLLFRCASHYQKAPKAPPSTDGRTQSGLTKDEHVERRRWLPIDSDPSRLSLISATDEEKRLARKMLKKIRDWLSARGWPEPIQFDSGNGYYLLYRIHLPADDCGLVERCLKALAARFGTKEVTVDQGVFNPARLIKTPGTLAARGDNKEPRPHRRSQLLTHELPDIVSKKMLEELAAEAPAEKAGDSKSDVSRNGEVTSNDRPGWFNVPEYLRFYKREFRVEQKSHNRTGYLTPCPHNEEHETCIMHGNDTGKMSVQCFHKTCKKGWQATRDKIGKPKPEHYKQAAAKKGKPGPILPWRPFPVDALPEPFRSYITTNAKAIGCDPTYIAHPLLPVIASAVGNTRRIPLKDSWDEPPCFWSVVVCESGTHKTPAMKVAFAPVKLKQGEAIRDFQAEEAAYRKNHEGVRPTRRRYFTSDPTVEQLAVLQESHPRGFLLIRDELSAWINALNKYHGGKGGDVAHYIEMFHGGVVCKVYM